MNKTLINSINKYKNFNENSSSFVNKSSSSSNSFDLNEFSKICYNKKGTYLIDAEGRYFVIKNKKK